MPLFQKSVLKKHILDQDTTLVDAAYKRFSAYFHDAIRQQNIRNAKEEQFQEGFLRELFGTVLQYTLNPNPDFNLTTELKNTTNSKKADGAILVNDKAVAVIELKGTETTDLNKIETQAFGYKNNQAECNYVITSNFEKLRFYIDNTIDYEEFNLFNLTREQFSLLYLCLSYDNIKNNVPKRLKAESVSQEDQVTKKLYKDYSDFKRALYNNLVELNPQFDKLLLFKKTRKLLDRFLFIFFAEDTNLLPTNLIFRINKEWKNLQEMRIPVSLYDRYLLYFNDLNNGAKVTLPAFGNKTGEAITAEFEIFAYNGGLFHPDEILDNVKIDDSILHTYTEKMSHYDFDSDVDVNILGHIFENSLNEIDEIKASTSRGLNPLAISSTDINPLATSSTGLNPLTETKKENKRKKDGVFYTPKYITKYIVDNTVGKLCEEKKAEIKLADEDYISDKKLQTKTKKALLDKLADYRAWLLQLTICDPACGSGAFLNQALEFLIAEHRYVDELQAKLMGDALILSDIENSILENNIYGVDLNDESVEIAKLSLWLRTAQKGRKLNSLNKNIKCGNSLIDDPEVAGDKAFSWEKEFPEVFKEKNKFAYHITTALNDSRTSERMVKYKARERRFDGQKPEPVVIWMTKEEEELIASTVAEIAKEDKLNIAAFNLCRDHMHILLVCEEDEVPKILHKIKGRTARVCNVLRNKGINPLDVLHKDGSTPFWTQKYGCKPITSDEQFWNTYNYIENNKVKHNLPKNPKLEKIIFGFVKTYEDCFKTEYTGGFDVVIGNPPYVRQELLGQQQKDFFSEKYKNVYNGIADLYVYFYDLSISILKKNGLLGFITPNKWMERKYGHELRCYLIHLDILQIINFGELRIFEDASTEPEITILKNSSTNNSNIEYKMIKSLDEAKQTPYSLSNYDKNKLDASIWRFKDDKSFNILEKFKNSKMTLSQYTQRGVFYGIKTGLNEAFIINEETRNQIVNAHISASEIVKKMVEGDDFSRWSLNHSGRFMLATQYDLDIPKFYPSIHKFLMEFEEKLIKRQDKGSTHWNLRSCDYYDELLKPKLIYYHTASTHNFYFDTEGYYISANCYFIGNADRYLQCVLNSKLFHYVKKFLFPAFGDSENGGRVRLDANKMSALPVKEVSNELKEVFKGLAEDISILSREFDDVKLKFRKYFTSQYKIDKVSGKLSNWFDLDFPDFIKELNKAIKTAKGTPLTKKDEFEWMELFEENKKKALELKSQIDQTDKEIDQMVYELYGLTEEEIKIVENV